jgi:hypothetical protein
MREMEISDRWIYNVYVFIYFTTLACRTERLEKAAKGSFPGTDRVQRSVPLISCHVSICGSEFVYRVHSRQLLRLSGISHVDIFRFSNVSTYFSVNIFRVNVCADRVGWTEKGIAVKIEWEVTDVIGQTVTRDVVQWEVGAIKFCKYPYCSVWSFAV